MIISVYLDDETAKTLREVAAREGRSIEELAECAVAEAALIERKGQRS